MASAGRAGGVAAAAVAVRRRARRVRRVGLGRHDASVGAVAPVAGADERDAEERAAPRAAHAGGGVEQGAVVAFDAVGAEATAVVAGETEVGVADAADAAVAAAVGAGRVFG